MLQIGRFLFGCLLCFPGVQAAKHSPAHHSLSDPLLCVPPAHPHLYELSTPSYAEENSLLLGIPQFQTILLSVQCSNLVFAFGITICHLFYYSFSVVFFPRCLSVFNIMCILFILCVFFCLILTHCHHQPVNSIFLSLFLLLFTAVYPYLESEVLAVEQEFSKYLWIE